MFRTQEMRPDQILLAPERVVRTNYTKEENYRAYKVFSMMDIDGGGSISLRELNRLMMGDAQRYVAASFSHPDSGIIFGLDEEMCVIISSIEKNSTATHYPFLIPRLRVHRINEDFYVRLHDQRSLHAVLQELLRLHDDPVTLEFYEPIIVINSFSCMLDIEIQGQIFSIELPVGAFYNHQIFLDKMYDAIRKTSPILSFIEINFIPNRRQVIFRCDVMDFRLLFATGPNYRRSCRYALGFSAEDLPFSSEHRGQPMLMDLRLGLDQEKMDILTSELFALYDADGSGEFEFEEWRDFYIEYLDSEESLERLKYYAKYRFRDIEREHYVKGLQQERTNKLARREKLKDKHQKVREAQRQRFMEDSYVDEKGLRRRNYRHRTKDRLQQQQLLDDQKRQKIITDYHQQLTNDSAENQAEVLSQLSDELNDEDVDDEGYGDFEDDAVTDTGDDLHVNLDTRSPHSTPAVSVTFSFHDNEGQSVKSTSFSDQRSELGDFDDDVEVLDELPQFKQRLDLSTLSSQTHEILASVMAKTDIQQTPEAPSYRTLNDIDTEPKAIDQPPEATVDESKTVPSPLSKSKRLASKIRSSKSRDGSQSPLVDTADEASPDMKEPQRDASTSSLLTDLVPQTSEDRMQQRRKANKDKQMKQFLRRQKILAKIIEANKALKKAAKSKAKEDHMMAVSIPLMEVHFLVKYAIMKSVKIDDVEEFDMMKAFSLNIHNIVASPAVQFTSAVLGQSLDPTSLDVELLSSSKMHPAGQYYYFLRDTHYHAAMATHRNRVTSSFELDPTRSKNDRTRPQSIGNVEYMHPAFFTADFIRQPTRRSQAALSYARLMKRKLNEGIQYRFEHGIKRLYDTIPPEDIIPLKTQNTIGKKKVRFLDVATSTDTEHGKLIGRLTVKAIKLFELASVHVFEKNSPFASIVCGPWKFATEVYSYAGDSCEWDNLNWTFRIYEPHDLQLIVRSGTVAKNYLIGNFFIKTLDLIELPRDAQDNIVICGNLIDTIAHTNQDKVFGKFELSVFLEKGQEWQWFMRAHNETQRQKDSLAYEKAIRSRTMLPQSQSQYDLDASGDQFSVPIQLQIMEISVFDLKFPKKGAVNSGGLSFFSSLVAGNFATSFLSQSGMNSVFLLMDTGTQERSTVDYMNTASRAVDDSSVEWKYLFWEVLMKSKGSNIVFKVFNKQGFLGRFALSGQDIVAKWNPGVKQLDFFGDLMNLPSSNEVTGKLLMRCNVTMQPASSSKKGSHSSLRLTNPNNIASMPDDNMTVSTNATSSKARRLKLLPALTSEKAKTNAFENEDNEDVLPLQQSSTVTFSTASVATQFLQRSTYDADGYLPGDLVRLKLPLLFRIDAIDIGINDTQNVTTSSILDSLLATLRTPTSVTAINRHVELTVDIDKMSSCVTASPLLKPKDDQFLSTTLNELSVENVGSNSSGISSSPIKSKFQKEKVLTFRKLDWKFPIQEQTQLTLKLTIGGTQFGSLHMFGHEFVGFKKNIQRKDLVVIHRFMHNSQAICGNITIAGYVSNEEDTFFIDRINKQTNDDYKKMKKLQNPAREVAWGTADPNVEDDASAAMIAPTERRAPVAGIAKTEQSVQSTRSGMPMIAKDISPAAEPVLPPVLLLTHHSDEHDDSTAAKNFNSSLRSATVDSVQSSLSFPIMISIHEIMATDLKAVHLLRKNSPQCTLAVGTTSQSTNALPSHGSHALWTACKLDFQLESSIQQLRIHLRSHDTTIGECTMSAQELLSNRCDSTGLREFFTHLVVQKDLQLLRKGKTSKTDSTLATLISTISRGKLRISYFLYAMPPLQGISAVPKDVSLLQRGVYFPVELTILELILLNLKSVHRFSKNSPQVKMRRVKIKSDMEDMEERFQSEEERQHVSDTFETDPLSFAGSYAKWMKLNWPVVLYSDKESLEFQVLSESMVIGNISINAARFLTCLPDARGVYDIDATLDTGRLGDFSTGSIRIRFGCEPYVSESEMLNYDTDSDASKGEAEAEADSSLASPAVTRAKPSLVSKSSVSTRKRPRDSLASTRHEQDERSVQSQRHRRSVLLVAMSTVLQLSPTSSHALRFAMYSLLKHKSIRVHLSCGTYFATAELLETTSDHVLSNINLLEKFVVDPDSPLRIRFFDVHGALLGESVYSLSDIVRSQAPIDNRGYMILEQELIRLEDTSQEVLGIVRIKVKSSLIQPRNAMAVNDSDMEAEATVFPVSLEGSNQSVMKKEFESRMQEQQQQQQSANGLNVNPTESSVFVDDELDMRKADVRRALSKVAPPVELPFHLRIKRISLLDLSIDKDLKQAIRNDPIVAHRRRLSIRLQYEQVNRVIVSQDTDIIDLAANYAKNPVDDDAEGLSLTSATDKRSDSQSPIPIDEMAQVDFIDSDLFYTVTNNFETWTFAFSMFPRQELSLGEVTLQVSDWKNSLLKSSSLVERGVDLEEGVDGPAEYREVFANLVQPVRSADGQSKPIIVGKISVLFQVQEIHVASQIRSGRLHVSGVKSAVQVGSSSDDRQRRLASAPLQWGYLRIKSISVSGVHQALPLFTNSLRVTVSMGHYFERLTDIIWDAGRDCRWDSLQWGKFPLFESVPITFRVSSSQTPIGELRLEYRQLLREAMAVKNRGKVCILGGFIKDGKIRKGRIEIACFMGVLDRKTANLVLNDNNDDNSNIQDVLAAPMNVLRTVQEDAQAEEGESTNDIDVDRTLPINALELQHASLFSKLSTSITDSQIVESHFDQRQLSDSTPTPASCYIRFMSLVLSNLRSPPDAIFRNSPQVFVSCGDWRANTNIAVLAGKEAEFLLNKESKWKLRVRGSPFIKLTVFTQEFCLGTAAFSVRDMIALIPDDIGMSSLVCELSTEEGRYAGVFELKFVISIADSRPMNMPQTHSGERGHGNVVDDHDDATIATHQTVHTISAFESVEEQQRVTSPNDVELPLSLKVLTIHVQDIPQQNVLVDASLSIFVRSKTESKIASLPPDVSAICKTSPVVTWENLQWDFRILSPDDFIALILSSRGKRIGVVTFSLKDILNAHRDQYGYLELSRKLMIRLPKQSLLDSAVKLLSPTAHTESAETTSARVIICVQLSNVIDKQQKNKLLEICKTFFLQEIHNQVVLARVKPRVVAISDLPKTTYRCSVVMAVGHSNAEQIKTQQSDWNPNEQDIAEEQYSALQKNLGGSVVFTVDDWPMFDLFDRMYITLYLESENGDLIGSLSLSTLDLLSASLDLQTGLATVCGSLFIGLSPMAKVSFVYQRTDIVSWTPTVDRVVELPTEVIEVEEPPRVVDRSLLHIIDVEASELIPIHGRSRKNSPLLAAEYRGLRYMTDSLPNAGEAGSWVDLNWPIECRESGLLKVKITSSAVEIGTATISMKELMLCAVNEWGEIEITATLLKKKQVQGRVLVRLFLITKSLEEMRRKRKKALWTASMMEQSAQETTDSSIVSKAQSQWSDSRTMNSEFMKMLKAEEEQDRVLRENISQFKQIYANERKFGSRRNDRDTITASDDTLSRKSTFDDTSTWFTVDDSNTVSLTVADTIMDSSISVPRRPLSEGASSGNPSSSPQSSLPLEYSTVSPSKSLGTEWSPASLTDFTAHSSVHSAVSAANTFDDHMSRSSLVSHDRSGVSFKSSKTNDDSIARSAAISAVDSVPVRSVISARSDHSNAYSGVRSLPSDVDDRSNGSPLSTRHSASSASHSLRSEDYSAFRSEIEDDYYIDDGSSRYSSRPMSAYSQYSDLSDYSHGSDRTTGSGQSSDYSQSTFSRQSSYSSATNTESYRQVSEGGPSQSVKSIAYSNSIASKSGFSLGESPSVHFALDSANMSPTENSQWQSIYSDNDPSHALSGGDSQSIFTEATFSAQSSTLPPTSSEMFSSVPEECDASDSVSHNASKTNSSVHSQLSKPAVKLDYKLIEQMQREHRQRRKKNLRYVFPTQSLQWIPNPYGGVVSELTPAKTALIVAETFVSNLIGGVVSSFVAMSLGLDFDVQSFDRYCLLRDVGEIQPVKLSDPMAIINERVTSELNKLNAVGKVVHFESRPPKTSRGRPDVKGSTAEAVVNSRSSSHTGQRVVGSTSSMALVSIAEVADPQQNAELQEQYLSVNNMSAAEKILMKRQALLLAVEVVRDAMRIGGSFAIANALEQEEIRLALQRKQQNSAFVKRSGILMRRNDSPQHDIQSTIANVTKRNNDGGNDDDELNHSIDLFDHMELEAYHKPDKSVVMLPSKARITLQDLIGIDLNAIDMRVLPLRPYLTACRPATNWAAETNPIVLDITSPVFVKQRDLIINFHHLDTRSKWENVIMRRGHRLAFHLHDANSGLIVAKSLVTYEEMIENAPERTALFDFTTYISFTITNEFGGGVLGGVLRGRADLSVNLFTRSKKAPEYWEGTHRPQQWQQFPLTPICYGVVRQQFKEIAEAYDTQQCIHPAFYGFMVRMRGNAEDESKFMHPIFQGYFLNKKVDEQKKLHGRDTLRKSALKSTAANPFRWDPTAKDRGCCPVCVDGLIGCPRCFMMPVRILDGAYFNPGEFAYDPEVERAKKLQQEQKLAKLAKKRARKLQAIQFLKEGPPRPPSPVKQLLPGTKKDKQIQDAMLSSKPGKALSKRALVTVNEDENDQSTVNSGSTSLTLSSAQSMYSQLSEQIESEFEEEKRHVILSEEQVKSEKPPFHTCLTTYRSLRLYRLMEQCMVDIFVKVLPTGYVRRIMCDAKDNMFQLYNRFNANSAFGNCVNSRMLLPTSVGVFEFFRDLTHDDDLLLADRRGLDRLEEFKLNEQNANYVLIFIKNYHSANVAGTLQAYLNKNTETIIDRLPIFNGVDKLPKGKVSEDPLQCTLREMVMTDYQLQQQDANREFAELGKTYAQSIEARRAIENAQEKMKAQYIKDANKSHTLRMQSQLKALGNDVVTPDDAKAKQKMLKLENGTKRNRRLAQGVDPPIVSSIQRGKGHRSKPIADEGSVGDTVSLSEVGFEEVDDENADTGSGWESSSTVDSALASARSDYSSASSTHSSEGSNTARSEIDLDNGDVEEAPMALPFVSGSSAAGRVSALRLSKLQDTNLEASGDIRSEANTQRTETDASTFFDEQDRLESIFSQASDTNSRLADSEYFDSEDDGDTFYDRSSSVQDSSYSKQSRMDESVSRGSSFYSSVYSTVDSTVGSHDYSADYSDSAMLTNRSDYSSSMWTASSDNTMSSYSSLGSLQSDQSSVTSYFTAVDEDELSSCGNSLFPVDRINTQSQHPLALGAGTSLAVRSLADSSNATVMGRLPALRFTDASSMDIYSQASSIAASSRSSLSGSLTSQSQASSSLDRSSSAADGSSYIDATNDSDGLYTYRSNISISTKGSDIQLSSVGTNDVFAGRAMNRTVEDYSRQVNARQGAVPTPVRPLATNNNDDASTIFTRNNDSQLSDSLSFASSFNSLPSSAYLSADMESQSTLPSRLTKSSALGSAGTSLPSTAHTRLSSSQSMPSLASTARSPGGESISLLSQNSLSTASPSHLSSAFDYSEQPSILSASSTRDSNSVNSDRDYSADWTDNRSGPFDEHSSLYSDASSWQASVIDSQSHFDLSEDTYTQGDHSSLWGSSRQSLGSESSLSLNGDASSSEYLTAGSQFSESECTGRSSDQYSRSTQSVSRHLRSVPSSNFDEYDDDNDDDDSHTALSDMGTSIT